MPQRTEFDLEDIDYWALTPEQRDKLIHDLVPQAIARARGERARFMGALAAWLWSRLSRLGGRTMTAMTGRWTAYRRWLQRRKAIAQLQALGDRELKDIGLRRSEIEVAVHGRDRDPSLLARGKRVGALFHRPYVAPQIALGKVERGVERSRLANVG